MVVIIIHKIDRFRLAEKLLLFRLAIWNATRELTLRIGQVGNPSVFLIREENCSIVNKTIY